MAQWPLMGTNVARWVGLLSGLVLGGCSSATPPHAAAPVADAAKTATPHTDIAGSWRGVLGSGDGALRLVVTLTRLADGGYAGQLDSVDQGAVLQASNITWEDEVLRFEIAAVGGVFEGQLDPPREVVVGTWTQTGVTPQPLTLRRDERESSAASPKAATELRPGAPFANPLHVAVGFAPRPFTAHDQEHLAYELHLGNLSRTDASVLALDVLADGHAIAHYDQAALATLLRQLGSGPSAPASIASGHLAIVYVWLTLAAGQPVPQALSHRLKVAVDGFTEPISVDTASITVTGKHPLSSPLILSPPLAGSNWLAGNGPSNDSGHRRAVMAVDGTAQIAQRLATDWVRVDEQGRSFSGDPKQNASYHAYGADVLAVAAGRIVAVVDEIPENVPGRDSRAVPITLQTIAGNHVVLELGQGAYAFYAHLAPGSIAVSVGDEVRPGQVLAQLGNSGNSSEPHLHFHVSNGPAPLASEGLPYEFSSYVLQATAPKPGEAPSAHAAKRIENQCPLHDDWVTFGAAAPE